MAYPFITSNDVILRVGRVIIDRAFDDDGNGTAKAEALERLCKDASSRVLSAIRAARRYDKVIENLKENPPEEVIRLSLDIAHYYGAFRHWEVMRQDTEEMGRAIDRELKALVKGDMLLDVEIPEDEVPEGEEPPPYPGGQPVMESDCSRGW
jgi:hypothetical protein